jgi:NADPH:quinone reductase-like Zn-dependent oxidoreductase
MLESKIFFTKEQVAEFLPVLRSIEPLEPDEIEGKTLYTMLSPGTEISIYLGNYAKEGLKFGKFPCEPGYAAVFTVEKTGDLISDVKPGDVVFCMGRHQSWQRVPRSEALPIPKGLAPEKALFARFMNVTMTSLTRTLAKPPAKVLVMGLGIIGLMGAQVFQRCGYDVTACDPIEERCRIAKRVGIEKVLTDVPVDDPEYKGKVSLVLECSSFEQAVLDGCNIVKKGGEVILVGVPMVRRSEIYAQEILNKVFRNSLILRSGLEWQVPRHEVDYRQNSLFGQMEAALKWLAMGSIIVEGLCDMTSPEKAQSIYQDVLHKRMKRLSAVFDWTKIPPWVGEEASQYSAMISRTSTI